MFRLTDVLYKDILSISNLIIPRNKVTCIIGKSGSGKTTILRLLNKLISPDSGDITYNEKSLKNIDSVILRKQVIMLPQVPVIFPGDIKENLLIGEKLQKKAFSEESRLLDTLQKVHLFKDYLYDASKLSIGEKQRLALARVLLLEPEVMLLDESSSALDDDTEKIVIDKVVGYTKANNKTLIMVTHTRAIAETYGELLVEVNNGKIVKTEERQ